MLYPRRIIDHIATSVYWGDRAIRSEMASGLIATENDYTSNLTAAIRRQINARAVPQLRATSYVLRPKVERAVGADACIVLANTIGFKLCIFEAKWPRLSTNKDSWDSLQKSSGLSHFDDQIRRQAFRAHLLATWEMFYSEFPFGEQPSYMPSHSSACVWHEHAAVASTARPNKKVPWSDSELASLLGVYGAQIDTLVREVCQCTKGFLFSGSNYLAPFENSNIPEEILVIKYDALFDENP